MIAQTKHTAAVRALRCVVSNTDQDIELHHCHSGSMADEGHHRGLSEKSNPFFQIPLNHEYHTGRFNPEAIGIRTWESLFGTQVAHLQTVSDLLGYDVFELAVEWSLLKTRRRR